MPNIKGVVLTDRDKVLLSYVGIARYASAEQVHRLFFDGRSKKQTYRRLAKLCRPGGRPGEGACLRRLEYRRKEGTGVPVWALTLYGRTLVVPLIPWLRPPAAHDVGHRFLEHTLLLNDVLAGLVLSGRRSDTAPLAELPFRWYSEDDGVLKFRRLGQRFDTFATSVLKPDAIVEIRSAKRRLFIEAETGTQSIVTAYPERTGAIVAKLQRYERFFVGRSSYGGPTWYRGTFDDDLLPRLVFFVHSDHRKQRVEKAVSASLGRSEQDFKVVVLTFAEAARKLATYLPPRPAQPPAPTPVQALPKPATATAGRAAPPAAAPGPVSPPRIALAVDERDLRLLRDSYRRLEEALQDAYEVVDEHQKNAHCQLDLDRLPRYELDYLRKIILNERPDAGGPAGTSGGPVKGIILPSETVPLSSSLAGGVSECRGCLAADDRRRFVDEFVVLEGLHHEQGEVHAARDVAPKNWVAHVSAPNGQALALAFFEVAPPHHGPPGVAGKHPPARFHLIVDVHEASETRQPADDLQGPFERPRVHVLAVPRDVPSAREHETRSRTRMVEHRLGRSRRVLMDPPGDEHREHPVAPSDRALDDLAVVCRSRNDCDASLERVELPHAALPADADHLVAPIQRVLHHVLPELPGGPDDTDLHRVPPVAHSRCESVGAACALKSFASRPLHRIAGDPRGQAIERD